MHALCVYVCVQYTRKRLLNMKNTTLYFVDVDGGEQQTREYARLQTSTISLNLHTTTIGKKNKLKHTDTDTQQNISKEAKTERQPQ